MEQRAVLLGGCDATRRSASHYVAPLATPAPNPPVSLLQRAALRGPLWPLYAIATVALIALLRWGENFFVPLLLGTMLASVLSPVVDWFGQWRLPRALSAAAALVMVAGALATIGYAIADDVREFIEDLPQAAQRLRMSLRETPAPGAGVVRKVRETAQELDRAAAETAGGPNAPVKAAAPVAPAAAPVSTPLFAWAGANLQKVAAGLTQVAVVFLLAFFLLASGDLLRRKMLEVAGPTLADKRETLRILSSIKGQVSGYLFQSLLINALLGLTVAAAFSALGVAHPVLWGVAAFMLRFVPYAGPSVLTAAAVIAAFLQSASYSYALLVGAAVVCVEVLIGLGLATWTQSRVARINATATFLGLLFFGWLWGPLGVFLGAPLVGVGRLVCLRIPGLRPVAVFLSR